MNHRYQQKLKAFQNICQNVAELSYDPKYKVGSIIFTPDFREICAMGYNGNYKGGPNEREGLETGQSGFLHAEENALYHLTKDWDKRASLIMMVTHRPCRMCMKRIINSGIKTVYYLEDYNDPADNSDDFVSNLGILIKKVS